MAQALYRKYRSKKLAEVVGQDHITTTLDNALKAGRLSHAYLFTGPRGVGKTSIARILAHEVNGLKYDELASHLDIIEIDAASNRRIDEIRDLRDKVNIAPASAKYKVYIIDEVHMLTKEAFNALLKTLEEPPAHVIFILATTEAHKLPETIVSRTQRFTFKPIDEEQNAKHLKSIAKKEGIEIDDESLSLIARHSRGSFRDSISLLEQVSNLDKKVTKETILKMLGTAPAEVIEQLVGTLETGQTTDLMELLERLRLEGYSAEQLAKQLSNHYRQRLAKGQPNPEAVGLLKQLLEVPASSDPDQYLELVLLDVAMDQQELPAKAPTPAAVTPTAASVKDTKPDPHPKPEPTPTPTPKLTAGKLSEKDWEAVLKAIKSRHNTLYSVLRMSEPSLSKHTLTLRFQFPFHQKRIHEDKNMATLQAILDDIFPNKVKVVTEVSPKAKPPHDPQLETINNIFGSAEVL